MSNLTPGELLRAKYDFRTDVFDIIVGGRSSIDSTEPFQISTLEEANHFIRSYGYDLEDPIESAEILGNYHESLNFIRKHFLLPDNPDGLKLEVPRKILELTDMRELFLIASMSLPGQTNDSSGIFLRNWACSLLKVMHTISHIDKDVRTSYFSDIQQQIFDRFYKLIHRDSEGKLFLGEDSKDPLQIELTGFETKPKKSRDSTILKLLHKPENVAEDIFDRVGIRFVTKTPLDALRVVKFLKDKMIIMPPNIKPSRSRNTLIQVAELQARISELIAKTELQELSEDQLKAELEHLATPSQLNPDNPHSSEFYRAIQFTCRQLIKLRNPIYDDLKELKALAKARSQQILPNRVAGEGPSAAEEPEKPTTSRDLSFSAKSTPSDQVPGKTTDSMTQMKPQRGGLADKKKQSPDFDLHQLIFNASSDKLPLALPAPIYFEEDAAKIIERIDMKNVQREIRFFYPFEVQIMDQKSAEENEKGRSAHSEYKKAQISTALKRVMGNLVDVVR